MKTAISLPDELFDQADALAKELGVSRSQLYARALERFVDEHRDDWVTKKLNEVYSKVDSSLDPVLEQLMWMSLPEDDGW